MLTNDEILYLKNLIATSGDIGYSWKIGDMKEIVIVRDLYNKLENIICHLK